MFFALILVASDVDNSKFCLKFFLNELNAIKLFSKKSKLLKNKLKKKFVLYIKKLRIELVLFQ